MSELPQSQSDGSRKGRARRLPGPGGRREAQAGLAAIQEPLAGPSGRVEPLGGLPRAPARMSSERLHTPQSRLEIRDCRDCRGPLAVSARAVDGLQRETTSLHYGVPAARCRTARSPSAPAVSQWRSRIRQHSTYASTARRNGSSGSPVTPLWPSTNGSVWNLTVAARTACLITFRRSCLTCSSRKSNAFLPHSLTPH